MKVVRDSSNTTARDDKVDCEKNSLK